MLKTIWYRCATEYNGKEIEKDAEYEKKLVNAFPELLMFTDINNCIDYISDCDERTISLILSDVHGIQSLSLIYQLRQFIRIYILEPISSMKQTSDDVIIKNSPVICGPFKQVNKLIAQLHCDVISPERATFTNPFDLLVDHLHTIDDIDERENERLHFQVILTALLRSDTSTDFVRQLMIDECRKHYTNINNIVYLRKIDEFEHSESRFSTFHWWSQDSFVYRLINEALRSRHWSSIMKYRYFIVKLYNEIKKLHQEQFPIVHSDDSRNQLLVYRGQKLFAHDWKLLENSVGGLVCINSFLSTTLYEGIAMQFAYACREEKTVAVIFRITLDRRVLSSIFADISGQSSITYEAEVLLSPGVVFRVENIAYDDAFDRWVVNLIATDPDKDSLLSFMLSKSDRTSLGQVLYQTGEYDAARDYCELMLRYTGEHLTHYSILGNIFKEIKEYDQALENHYKALKFVTSIYQCSVVYYNLGLAYLGKGDYNRALHYHHEAYELECVEGETEKLALIYHNMGFAYIKIGALRLGVDYLEKALDIQNSVLPSNHYHLGCTYLNLGDYYRAQNESGQALEYYQHALDIFRCSRQHDQNAVTRAHFRIAKLYSDMDRYDMMTRTFEQLIKAYGRMANGLALARVYMMIMECTFYSERNLKQCATYAEYILTIRRQHLDADHRLIGITHYILGSLQLGAHMQCFPAHDFAALINGQKNLMRAAEILKSCPTYSIKVIENLAFVYRQLKLYDKAIVYFKQSIEHTSID
ncbi:unnamed protein product, partial [Adineta ricciae]